ncbi:MAG TPA: LptA/OstA family protein, partial [Verrucomicrobiae bacterium]|nr:LptA/OstA family protein [Verrucomicrobiae bacterium]
MRYRATFFLAALLLPLAPRAHGQAGGVRNFTFPDPYPPPHQDRAKTITTGEEMIPQPDGSYLLKGVKIQTFRDTGDTNASLTMQAPSCIFDRKDHNASSPGPLQIDSGDGNMHIEGEGFLWLAGQTNTALTISNKVHTIIKKRYLAGQTNTDVFPTPVSNGATNNAPGTNQVINVYSDHFHYDRQTDLITYSDHVQSEDSEIILTCDVMTIQRTTNGAVETIVGDGHVVIVNKADGGRTTSDHAVYTTKPDKQEVVLTGNPRLLQARREGTGKVFIFDHLQNTLRIEGDAYLKLPRESVGQSGLLLGSPSAQTNAPASNPTPSGTNGLADKFVEIYSDSMLFQMPPTNGPVQKVIADRNVVIVDLERNSRGTGGHAVY